MLPRGARIGRLSPAQARVARGSQLAMLGAERDALADLTRAAEDALGHLLRAVGVVASPERTRGTLLVVLRHAADELRLSVGRAVLRGREGARRAAWRRIGVELDQVAQELRVEVHAPPPGDAPEDAGLAQSAAESYVAAWRAALTVAVLRWQDGPPHGLLGAAHDAQAHRLARIAATEIPQAYNAEHDDGAGWVAERHEDARWLPLVVKRWDAALDRKTCAVCRDMDGSIAPLAMSFTGGRLPGSVHPWDRCQASIIVIPLRTRRQAMDETQLDV